MDNGHKIFKDSFIPCYSTRFHSRLTLLCMKKKDVEWSFRVSVSTTRAIGLQTNEIEDEDLWILFFVDPYSAVSFDGWKISSSEFTAPNELGL